MVVAIIHLRLHQERGPTAEVMGRATVLEAQQLRIQVAEAEAEAAIKKVAATAVLASS